MFHKLLDYAEAGDNIGALLRGVDRNGIERGQVLAKPGSIHPHTKFKGQVYVLTKEEGGRHTPFFNNYRPQFYFRTTDVTGVITLPEGTEMCMPGDNVENERGADLPPSPLRRACVSLSVRVAALWVPALLPRSPRPDFSAKKKNCRNAAVLFLPAGHSERAQSCSG